MINFLLFTAFLTVHKTRRLLLLVSPLSILTIITSKRKKENHWKPPRDKCHLVEHMYTTVTTYTVDGERKNVFYRALRGFIWYYLNSGKPFLYVNLFTDLFRHSCLRLQNQPSAIKTKINFWSKSKWSWSNHFYQNNFKIIQVGFNIWNAIQFY